MHGCVPIVQHFRKDYLSSLCTGIFPISIQCYNVTFWMCFQLKRSKFWNLCWNCSWFRNISDQISIFASGFLDWRESCSAEGRRTGKKYISYHYNYENIRSEKYGKHLFRNGCLGNGKFWIALFWLKFVGERIKWAVIRCISKILHWLLPKSYCHYQWRFFFTNQWNRCCFNGVVRSLHCIYRIATGARTLLPS